VDFDLGIVNNAVILNITLYVFYAMIYLLTAAGLTPGGNCTVHIYTHNSKQNNKMTQNIQNGTYITIRIHKRYLYIIKQKHTKHTTIYTLKQNRTKRFL